MNFYQEIGIALSSKKHFYTKKDVRKIADIIDKRKDIGALEEIEFELSANPGSIFFGVWDVLNDRYTYKKDLENYYNGESILELNRKIVSLYEYMARISFSDLEGSNQNDFLPLEELQILFRSLERAKSELDHFFLDPASERKQFLKDRPGRTYRGFEKWSKDASYWLLIEKCAKLYERLYSYLIRQLKYSDTDIPLAETLLLHAITKLEEALSR